MVFIPSTCSRITSRVSSRIWCGAIWRVHHLRADSVVWLSHTSSIWPWSGAPKVCLYDTFLGGLRQIPEDQDVESRYSTNRTPCKMAVTRLEQAGIGDEFVDRMNRWRAQEQSKGCFVRRMNTHYADAMLLTPMTWLGLYFLWQELVRQS
jgi:hypothetical protein